MADTLQLGSKGDAVTAGQRLLNFHLSLNPPLTEFGVFGSATQARVREFQRQSGLVSNGAIDPPTTKALLPVGRVALNASIERNFLLPRVPNFRLDPSLATLRRVGPLSGSGGDPRLGFRPIVDRPLNIPDWFYNRLPQRSWHLDNVQFSTGNEIDIPKGSDSSPLQFEIEFTFLKKRDGKDETQLSVGADFSSTPQSSDGRWSAKIYGKAGLSDWKVSQMGPLSLSNPYLQAYVNKATKGSATAGVEVGDEIDIKLAEKKGNYALEMYSTIGLDLQLFDIEHHSSTLKAALPIGLGLKFTLFTPEWMGEAPGHARP